MKDKTENKEVEIEGKTTRPFLRWAGGKSWLVNDISSKLTISFNNYHEPFLGSAAIFIKLKSEGKIKHKAYLNDINTELINAYRQIKNHPDEVCNLLRTYRNNEIFYYRVRGRDTSDNIQKASNFIYLNRTCFNGIYRVNLDGEFNVPFGFKTYRPLFDYDNMTQMHDLLKANVRLISKDFFDILENIKKNDLVFIDPPYTVNHENNGFIKYNEKIFSWQDQIRLKIFIKEVIKKKAYFILTNASHESIYQLFGDITKPVRKERISLIGGKNATRGMIHEYVFSNCLKK